MKKLAVLLAVLGLSLSGGLLWWQDRVRPANPGDGQERIFVVLPGDGVREIARNLEAQGLVKDKVAFFILVKKLGLEKKIQAGSFRLAPNIPARELAQRLTVGTQDRWLTIPEGWRVEEVLEHLATEKMDDGRWTIEGEVGEWKKEEGKLFPDTYLIPETTTITELRELMRRTFDEKTRDLVADATASGLTWDQVVILASLVEREARTDVNRAKVANVLLKRLRADMALDVDATVQYALGKQPDGSWWKKELLVEDLKIASPYNTYKNASLPPGPICNPSLSALRAVVYSDPNPYYYYLTDKEGVMRYAKTLEEHNLNVARYLPN